MPEITADVQSEPLFSDDDPLILVVPEVGKFRLSDYEVNPPNDAELNPETRPLAYIVEYLASMIWEDDDATESGFTPNADEFREEIVKALDENRLSLETLGGLLTNIGNAVTKARKARTTRHSRRPTKGPRT